MISNTMEIEIISIIENIAYFSETQEQLTENLTALRGAAKTDEGMEIFGRCLKIAKEGAINTDEMNGFELRFHYTLYDFTETEEPYNEVYCQPSAFLKERALERIASEATKCGYRRFKQTYKAFEVSMSKRASKSIAPVLNPTDFPNQPLELECGTKWKGDSSGVHTIVKDREEYACLHPIMPVERLVNIDTGEEKLRIAFFKGKNWRSFIASKLDLFDASKIIKYSALGVSVTSKSSKLLSEYLCDIETLNPDVIPEIESVGRLGYIGDGTQFAPYVDGIVFDGDANYRTLYNAISEAGSYETWLSEAIKCREDSLTAKIMLAASFASPLVQKIGCLPFFVHLWSVASETGKTVSLMLAASVWGNPDKGNLVLSFNSTQVSTERTAAFLNNVPMCLDELQLTKDSHGKSKFDVYQLAQGVGRGRGNKSGGIDTVPTWNLCILSTGESPIVQDSAGAGAVNRVIDIECLSTEKVIVDGFHTSSTVKQNYGFAGRRFIESLDDDTVEQARERYKILFKQLAEGNSTEKQAMAAAMLVLADEFADRFIFKTGQALTVEQIAGFLKAKSEVSAGQRAYNFLCDWVAVNANRFTAYENSGEFWGKISEDESKVYIISAVFRNALSENGFDERAVTSWLRANKKIVPYKDGKNSQPLSIDGHKARFIEMILQAENEIPDNEPELL